jgi:hypothetical protein
VALTSALSRDRLAVAQGAYYAATGVWSLVHLRSFEAVTGPKADDWLVKTVGVLVTAIGGALARAGLRRRTAPDLVLLAAGSAVGLLGIDVWYAARGRISRVYLLDAVGEAALLAAWAAVSATAPAGSGARRSPRAAG